MNGGTVKQFKDTLEEMKKVYKYNDEKTFLSTYDAQRIVPYAITLITTDEKTGVEVRMHKRIEEKQL